MNKQVEQIRAEVERLITEYGSMKTTCSEDRNFKQARLIGYNDVLHFIDSLSEESESVSNDVDSQIKKQNNEIGQMNDALVSMERNGAMEPVSNRLEIILCNEIKNTGKMIKLFYKWLRDKELQCQKDNDADSERLLAGIKSMFVEIFGWQSIKGD